MRRLIACCALSLLSVGVANADTKAAPLPFLVAERGVYCGPGWTLTFYPNGRVVQVTTDTCIRPHKWRRTFQLTPVAVRDLQALLTASAFHTLPVRLAPESIVTDEDWLIIRAGSGSSQHTVSANGLERMSPSSEVQRFLLVWSGALDSIVMAGQ